MVAPFARAPFRAGPPEIELFRRPRRRGSPQPVLSIRARVPAAEAAAFTRVALGEVRRYIEDHHGEIEGPPFAIQHAESTTHVDLEVGWPTRHLAPAGRIAAGALPVNLIRRGGDHHIAA